MNPVIFLHIPKTGGGALDNALRGTFRNPAPRYSWTEAQSKAPEYWREFDYISGHYPYLFTGLFENPLIVTLLRDPVARVLSHYAYVHAHGYWRDPDFSVWVQRVSLEEWLGSERTLAHTNLQARFLNNRLSYRVELLADILDSIAVVGFQDIPGSIQDVADEVCERADVQYARVSTANENRSPYPLRDLNGDTLRRIQEMNVVDSILVNLALKREMIAV